MEKSCVRMIVLLLLGSAFIYGKWPKLNKDWVPVLNETLYHNLNSNNPKNTRKRHILILKAIHCFESKHLGVCVAFCSLLSCFEKQYSLRWALTFSCTYIYSGGSISLSHFVNSYDYSIIKSILRYIHSSVPVPSEPNKTFCVPV